MTLLRTVGHGAGSLDDLLSLLEGVGVRRIVDVRVAPGSRRHPHFGKDVLARALGDRGMAYDWRKELGGWRTPRPDSRHTALRNRSFRGYADHMETEEFREALAWLAATSARAPTAIMCAESVWWRCHRSFIADGLVARGHEVRHLMPDGSEQPHRLHRAARIDAGAPVYDAAPLSEP